MHPQRKYLMPSHQKIIKFMYNNGERCWFNKQKIYKNRKAFNRAMHFLVRNNICSQKCELVNGSKKLQNIYNLTLDGILLWEKILCDLR